MSDSTNDRTFFNHRFFTNLKFSLCVRKGHKKTHATRQYRHSAATKRRDVIDHRKT